MSVTPQAAIPTDKSFERAARRRRGQRRVLGIVMIPVVLSLIFYLLIAPPEYRSDTEFSIQGTRRAGVDLLGGLGIPAISPSSNDAKLVVDYVRSPEMIALLRKRFAFDKAYDRFTLVPGASLAHDAGPERDIIFWQSHVKVDYDATSNIIDATVTAYTPADAKRLTEGVVEGARTVVASLDNSAQSVALKVATAQLSEQKADLETTRRRVAGVRGTAAMTLDAQAIQSVQTVSQVDGELARLRVEAATADATYQPGTPQANAVRTQIAALEQVRAAALSRSQSGPGNDVATGDIAARTALFDYEFAEKSYYAALQAYQAASSQSDANHRFVVDFIPPHMPVNSNYFTRLWNVLAIGIGSAILLATAMLTISVVKDHMQ